MLETKAPKNPAQKPSTAKPRPSFAESTPASQNTRPLMNEAQAAEGADQGHQGHVLQEHAQGRVQGAQEDRHAEQFQEGTPMDPGHEVRGHQEPQGGEQESQQRSQESSFRCVRPQYAADHLELAAMAASSLSRASSRDLSPWAISWRSWALAMPSRVLSTVSLLMTMKT